MLDKRNIGRIIRINLQIVENQKLLKNFFVNVFLLVTEFVNLCNFYNYYNKQCNIVFILKSRKYFMEYF